MSQEDQDKQVRELQEKIRILESENESLTERGEDTMLLSLISEQINNLSEHDDILDIALEQISVLKGLMFSASATLKEETLQVSRSFCSMRPEGLADDTITLPPGIIANLERETALIDCDDPGMKGLVLSESLAGLTPRAILVIPTWGRMFPDHFFVFANDISVDSLRESSNLLQRTVEMVAGRLDNLILIDQISRMNKELDQKVERRTAQLRESEALYRSLVDNIDMGVTLIDADYNVLMANRAQGKMFNRDPALFLGRKCFVEFEKRDDVCEHCPGARAMETGKPAEANAEGETDDGASFTVRIRAFPLYTEDGKPKGFIEVVENVTEKTQIEEDLQRVKKFESMSVLAGGIAHDFNNLLTAVMGNISLLKLYAETNDKFFGKLTEMEKATLRARELTQQLLTFAKGGSPIKQTTSVKELAVDAATFALRGSSAECRFDFSDDLWLVDVDPGQFTQIIQNLVINASQASPSGGFIHLSAENYDHKVGEPYALLPGEYIKVSVRDEGEGIEREMLGRIFDPYFTTKETGTGIGLATSYSIVRKHGGMLTVESEPGSGSTFSFYLPVSENKNKSQQETGKEIPSQKDEEAISTGEGRILVMDDEMVVLDVVREMLEYSGYRVDLCKSGQEALELYKLAAEEGDSYAAVILDLTIPGEGWGGIKSLEKIKEINPAVKAIVSSGYANHPTMVNFSDHGFAASVSKPYRIKRLSMALARVLAD